MALPALIPLLLVGATDLMSPQALQAGVEAFAGKPALVDPRLLLPACARPAFAMASGGRSVMVRCVAPEWRVFVPVGEGGAVAAPAAERPVPALPVVIEPAPRATPSVRRGDQVTVEVGGDGFVIGMAATADADARDGRVAVRSNSGGRRFHAIIGDDGRIRLRGLNSMVNGR